MSAKGIRMSYNTAEIRPLSKELQQKAENELNENTDRIPEELRHLREWVKNQHHITARQDDTFLITYLRCCKYNQDKAKQKIEKYYKIKSTWGEVLMNRNPMSFEVQTILQAGALFPLSQPIRLDGPKISFIRWGACNPETMTFPSILKVASMMADILFEEDDNTVVGGIHFLMDFKDMHPSYLLQFTPSIIYKTLHFLQSAYPIRINGLDFINVPSILQATLFVIRTFLKPKLKNRLHSYSGKSMHEFYQRMDRRILPIEYGGSTESLKDLTEMWKTKLESYTQWFAEDEKYRLTEDSQLRRK